MSRLVLGSLMLLALALGEAAAAAGAPLATPTLTEQQAAPATIAYSLHLTFRGAQPGAPVELGGLCLARADGGGASRLTAPAADFGPAWSPDGRHLAFTRARSHGLPQPHEWDVHVLDVLRARTELVSFEGPAFNYGPVWRPDGRSFVYTSGWRSYDLVWGGPGEGGSLFMAVGNWFQHPGDYAWAPDGSRLAIAGSLPGGSSAVFVRDVESEEVRRVVPFGLPVGSLAWSRDGRRIAFTRGRHGGPSDLYAVDAEGGEPELLVRGAAEPAWSPDGERVAYVDTRGDVLVAAADGAGARPLAPTAARERSPAWSPDGRSVAFVRESARGDAIVVAAADGTGARVAVRPRFGVGSLAWRPGGGAPASPRPCVRQGSDRADLLRGTQQADVIAGGAGADRLVGRGGGDVLDGGAGDDVLEGGAGNDVLHGGPGADRIVGGAGDDLVLARDGRRDTIVCGPGRDRVLADRIDFVARDCERVVRR